MTRDRLAGADRSDHSARKPWGSFEDHDGWTDGHVYTPWGVVLVYLERARPVTSMCCVIDGRHHDIKWDRTFSTRYMVTLAMAFAADCWTAPA